MTPERLMELADGLRRIMKDLSDIHPGTTMPLAHGSKEYRAANCIMDAQADLRKAVNIIVKPNG